MEARLFESGEIPACTTAAWYEDREAAPHLEQTGHRDRLLHTAWHVRYLADVHQLTQAVDLGCGDGGLLSLLQDLDCWGYDLCPANVEAAARRGVRVELRDIMASEPDWAPVAVCTEMLEHLLAPHDFLRRVAEHSRFLVASSPWTETAEAHLEYHTWAWDPAGYQALIEGAGFQILRHEPVLGFQLVAAERK